VSTTDDLTELDEALPSEPDETGEHHASDKLYVQIFVILFVVTAAEVSTYYVDFGKLLLPALMVMMVFKFAMVAMFFMHLRFDHKLFSWVFVSGLALAVAVYIVMLTTFEYWQTL
jgi:cytochrome c oxidase subunit IV